MSAAKNKGGSARAILERGSRQVQPAASGAAEGEGEARASRTSSPAPSGRRSGGHAAKGSGTVSAVSDGGAASGKKTAAARGGTKKRITVDLFRDEHKFLRDFAYDADSDGMRVVRALLAELRRDEELSARIRDRLAGE